MPSYPHTSSMTGGTTTDKGREVWMRIPEGGRLYTLSPGCSITITGGIDLNKTANGEGEFYLMPISSGDTLTLRIDAVMFLRGAADTSQSDGFTTYPDFDPFEFIYDVMSMNPLERMDLYYRDQHWYGRISGYTITQRPGEGNMVDLSITYLIGLIVPE